MQERGVTVRTGDYDTNVLVWGDPAMEPVVLLAHGSGAGATAAGAWAWLVPSLREAGLAVIAPDLAGFGWTERVPGFAYGLDAWSDQLAAVLDAFAVPSCAVHGNSLGGAIALAFAIREPARVTRVAVTGSVGSPHAITPALELVWGYEPTGVEAMRAVIAAMPADPGVVTDAAVAARYEASIRDGWQASFRAMFPHPLQSALDAMAMDEADLARLRVPVLLLHGREDPVVPVDGSIAMARVIPDAELRVYGGVGHWPAVEAPERYAAALVPFLGS